MSYCIVDSTGKYCGDLATIKGMEELDLLAGNSLQKFLDSGQADLALVEEIKAEIADSERLRYIAELFAGEAPFLITDGIVDEDL